MANVLEYAKIFMQELDKQVVAQATSGWMEANAGLVKYNGGDEVKIPEYKAPTPKVLVCLEIQRLKLEMIGTIP